jgi:hypothetical protein
MINYLILKQEKKRKAIINQYNNLIKKAITEKQKDYLIVQLNKKAMQF